MECKSEKKETVLENHFSSPLACVQKNPEPRNPALKHKDKELNTYTARFLIFFKKACLEMCTERGKGKLQQSPAKDKRKLKETKKERERKRINKKKIKFCGLELHILTDKSPRSLLTFCPFYMIWNTNVD